MKKACWVSAHMSSPSSASLCGAEVILSQAYAGINRLGQCRPSHAVALYLATHFCWEWIFITSAMVMLYRNSQCVTLLK